MREHPACCLDPVDRTTVQAHEAETNRIFKQYLLVARCGRAYKPSSGCRLGECHLRRSSVMG